MGYRKSTIRKMYHRARRLAALVNEFESLLRVLKNQVKVMNDMEFAQAAYQRMLDHPQEEAPPLVGALKDDNQDQPPLLPDDELSFPGLDDLVDGKNPFLEASGSPGDVWLGKGALEGPTASAGPSHPTEESSS